MKAGASGQSQRVPERGGQMPSWKPVRLPHDVMIGSARNPSDGPGQCLLSRRHMGIPEEVRRSGAEPGEADVHRVRGCVPRRCGIGERKFRRSPSVWVHGVYMAIDHLVRHGEENEVLLEVTAQEDARWYSGAGIYRNVKLAVGESVHLPLDSLWVTTPEIDDSLAVVEVAALVENDGMVTRPTTVETQIVDDRGVVVVSAVSPLTSFPWRSGGVRQRLAVPDPAVGLWICRPCTRVRSSSAILMASSSIVT